MITDEMVDKAQEAYNKRMGRYEKGKKAMQSYAVGKNYKEEGVADLLAFKNENKNYRLIPKTARGIA